MRVQLLAAALIFLMSGTAFAAQVVVTIDKHSQEMTVMVDGQEEYIWPVSTGIARYATPSGTYQPFRMEEFHFSEEWDDAAMPNSIFFTRSGHAIHGTEHVEKLGERASHGCVRLDPTNAATLFYLVQEVGLPNTTVIITGTPEGKSNLAAGIIKSRKKTGVAKVGKTIPLYVDEVAEDETADAIGVIEEKAANRSNRKRELWPYERLN